MTLLDNIPPAFLLIIGAFILLLLPATARKTGTIALAFFGFYAVSQLSEGSRIMPEFLGFDLTLLRVDSTSKAFGYIFTLSAFGALIFSWSERSRLQNTAALAYVGSALGVVFAGDMISWYLFWEMMAISSTFLILARNNERSRLAAQRYILIHLAGGLVLLTGILLAIHETGSVAFTKENIYQNATAKNFILIGILINAAAVPFSSWLPDAYPESTVFGGIILSAYTTKTAVYTLVRGFPGEDILIPIGCVMAVYGIIYALLENDMRRILAYSIINQVGFMVCGVGIGTKLAIAGVVAHAFCHIIYKSLLWMSAGAVLYRTNKSKCTELGGLYKTMPITMVLGTIGALAISGVPLTSGFISKTLITAAAEHQNYLWAWLALEVASAGVFLHAGIKFPFFVFFNVDRGLRPKEAPRAMIAGMSLMAFLCIYLGLNPSHLYSILPNNDILTNQNSFYEIYIKHFDHVATMFQMLIFSGLSFFLFLPMLRRTPTISIDFDWFYRKGANLFYCGIDKTFNSINRAAEHIVIKTFLPALARFIITAPASLTVMILRPIWQDSLSADKASIKKHEQKLIARFSSGTFPVAYSAIFILIFIGILIFLGRSSS
ncbi:MAG: Na(+)/H(+) antiporter subunit D [Verrucomicrobiota bacterium]|nr:Na(+)/H(+) antiporter subunit D [Verrucomicrobiota bacterium]MEE2615731.1 Na(+)/H(+) antiporter subunit D [Verrucomicrobiota bacterium]